MVAFFTPPPLFRTKDVDPFFEWVTFLMHAEGANGSTAFVDSSNEPDAFSSPLNATLTTAQKKFGDASLNLASGYVRVDGNICPQNVAYNWTWGAQGTGDFTLEMFFRCGATAGANALLSTYANSTAGMHWRLNTTNIIFSLAGDPILLTSTALTPVVGQWYHVAVCRSGGTLYMFVDGVQVASAAYTGVSNSATNGLIIGALASNGSQTFNGQFDEIRITRGIARYTSNFTPPTKAFPDTGPSIPCKFIGCTGIMTANTVVTWPTGTQAGDIAILSLAGNAATTQAGWNLIAGDSVNSPSQSSFAWKVLTASDISSPPTLINVTTGGGFFVVIYRGGTTVTKKTTASGGTAASVSVPGFAKDPASKRIIAFTHDRDPGYLVGQPSGFICRRTFQTTYFTYGLADLPSGNYVDNTAVTFPLIAASYEGRGTLMEIT